MTTKTRPVHEIRLGRIKVAIWGKQLEGHTRYNATFARLFKEEGKTWQDSSSFGREDLPLLAKVADLAHTWIHGQGAEPAEVTDPLE